MKKRAAGSANREKGTVEALRQEPSAAALERLREERSGPSRYRAAEKRLRAQLGWYREASFAPMMEAGFLFLHTKEIIGDRRRIYYGTQSLRTQRAA